MIDYSSNEAASLVKLAARGVGYPWGVAEESAYASRWFAEQQLDSLSFFSALYSWVEGQSEVAMELKADKGVFRGKHGELCPLMAGCTVSDFAKQITKDKEMVLENVVCAVILLPFLFQISSELKIPVGLYWNDDALICDAHMNSAIASSRYSRDQLCTNHAARTMFIRLNLPAKKMEAWSVKASLRVKGDSNAVQFLKQLAHRTYAPATEESRLSGAGAGTTDND